MDAPILSPRPSAGFVVAMHARIDVGGARRREWIIVARWAQGEHLSIGFTGCPAASPPLAPIMLTPRHTMFARSQGTRFHFADILPDGITLAGSFLPASGTLRLLRDTPALVLLGQACSPVLSIRWRFRAIQSPWIGTFVESPQT